MGRLNHSSKTLTCGNYDMGITEQVFSAKTQLSGLFGGPIVTRNDRSLPFVRAHQGHDPPPPTTGSHPFLSHRALMLGRARPRLISC